MLFDRQRVLLELLDALNEPVGSTDFQKLLFLYTREGEPTPSYDFVPYRFGCFSFTSYADKRRLMEQGLIEEDEQTWKLTDKGRRIARAGEKSPLPMARFAKQYKNLRGNALVADVYQRYPYFATRSEIVEKVLPKKEDRARVESARPAKKTPGLGHAWLRKQNLGGLPESTAARRRDFALRCPAESVEPEIWFFQKHVEPCVRRRRYPLRAFAGIGHPVGKTPRPRNADRLRQAVRHLRTHDAAEANQDADQNRGLD